MIRTTGKSIRNLLFRKTSRGHSDSVAFYDASLKHIESVCKSASEGDLQARIDEVDLIANAHGMDEDAARVLLSIADRINHVLDMSDAYVRESRAALEAASEGRFYRRILERGLRGDFGNGARVINSASATMEKAAATADRLQLALDFEAKARVLVESVAAAAVETNAAADTLMENTRLVTDAARQASERASCVASEVVMAVENGRTVSQAASDIASRTEQSLRITADAEVAAAGVNRQTEILNEDIKGIGSVISLIRGIAAQTNILSLNAAVEAARAGEAGKGFAVVAEEVRSLAGRTAEATRTVEERIAALQSTTKSLTKGIHGILEHAANSSSTVQAIANSASVQIRVSEDMRSRLEGVSASTLGSSTALADNQQAADEAASAAEEVHAASAALEHTASELDNLLSRYLASVRSPEAIHTAGSTSTPPTPGRAPMYSRTSARSSTALPRTTR